MKIFIHAYTQLNLGDDLFVRILCERYPDSTFYMMSSRKYSMSFKSIDNLKIIPVIRGIDRILSVIKNGMSLNLKMKKWYSNHCDAIVCIGGSIFMQSQRWEEDAKRFRDIFVPNNPFYVIGSNFGPFSDNKFLEEYKNIFDSLTDVCFRDNYSYNLFSKMENVRVESDVVFSYHSISSPKTVNRVIISPVDVYRKLESSQAKDPQTIQTNYIKLLSGFIRKFVEEGYTVTLMAFCLAEGDGTIIERIQQAMEPRYFEKIDTYLYRGNLDEALQLINESKFVIASRFHAMILGWLYGKIVYPVVYSDKSLNVMKDTHFSGPYADLRNLGVTHVEEDYNKLKACMPLDISDEALSANKQFAELDKLIRRHPETNK